MHQVVHKRCFRSRKNIKKYIQTFRIQEKKNNNKTTQNPEKQVGFGLHVNTFIKTEDNHSDIQMFPVKAGMN